MLKRTVIALVLAVITALAPIVLMVELGTSEYSIVAGSLESSYAISDNLYGIFLEDINYGVDGGLNANQIQNNSFEYTYLREAEKFAPFELESSFWELDDLSFLTRENPICNDNPISLKTVVNEGSSTIYNLGYGEVEKDDGSIFIESGKSYEIAFFADGEDFDGSVKVSVVNEEGNLVGEEEIQIAKMARYTRYERVLASEKEGYGKLKVEIEGSGVLYLDTFSLRDTASYGYGKEEWGDSSIRADLFEALKALNPSFVRFPGGCLSEGAYTWENDYPWKDTVKQNELRKQIPNLWGYFQSMEIGFYEYFLLTEALGATPVPVLGAGVLCQARGGSNYPLDIDSVEFEEIVQNALDLIEFANGDITTEYGSLRKELGHSEPFNMKYIAIGNENWGEVYYERFGVIYNAIKEKYPEIKIISSSGPHASGEEYDYDWEVVRSQYADTVVDEHYYVSPQTLVGFEERYDAFPRSTNVFVGEYAAHSEYFVWWDMITRNNVDGALAEAVFLTGVERNGDLIEMATYAPLLCKYGFHQWAPNLIWFNAREVILTPSYYVQYLNMNYTGKEYLPASSSGEGGVYHSLTIDKEKGKAYLKVVNVNDERVDFRADLSSLGKIFPSVKQNILRSNSLETYNDLGSEKVFIQTKERKIFDEEMKFGLPKYSYSVFEIDFVK